MEELIYKDEVNAIIRAAMAVYNELGSGFLEAIYQEAFEMELTSRGIPYISQPNLFVMYKGKQLQKFYTADLIIYDKIIVEIKTIDHLSSVEVAQMLNELKASNMELGLLINFGSTEKLEWSRWVFTEKKSHVKSIH